MINHLTSSDFQRSLMKDQSTKLNLILASKIHIFTMDLLFVNYLLDEERNRHITKGLSDIDKLARVPNGEYFQGILCLLTLFVAHTN